MGTLTSIHHRTMLCVSVLAITVAAAVERVQALRMTDFPDEQQTKTAEARDRTLSLKLPLRQPIFHWTFLSRQAFLAGKLVLHIVRDGESTSITIFENGRLSNGWQPMPLENPKAGEIYFGFQSSRKYSTAPGDRVKIELEVANDLDGIGPLHTGILPAGTYTAEGRYSALLDGDFIPQWVQDAQGLPEELVEKMRQSYALKAFLENWEEQWDLRITSENGWLPSAKRKGFKQGLKAMADEDAKTH